MPQPEPEVVVLPDATREEMLQAAGMTTGHRWEERYVTEVAPGTETNPDDPTEFAHRQLRPKRGA